MSEEDETIIAASDLIKLMNATVPPTAATKVSHAKVLQQLTAIITNQPVPRVEAVPRVGGTPTNDVDQPN